MAQTTTRQVAIEDVSADLKLRYRGTGSAAAGTAITVIEFADIFDDARAPIAAYLCNVGTPDTFRKVVDINTATGVCTVSRSGLANAAVDLYLILTPPDWRECVTKALRRLYFTERFAIAVVSGSSIYAMPVGKEWLQTEQQLKAVLFEWTDASSGRKDYQEVPAYEVIEDSNAISLYVPSLPVDITGLQFIIEGKHFYEALATEAATTTCPAQLFKAQLKWEALKKIWHLMGEEEAVKEFAQEMKDAEAELLDAKRQHIKQIEAQPFHVSRVPTGPELAVPKYRW